MLLLSARLFDGAYVCLSPTLSAVDLTDVYAEAVLVRFSVSSLPSLLVYSCEAFRARCSLLYLIYKSESTYVSYYLSNKDGLYSGTVP